MCRSSRMRAVCVAVAALSSAQAGSISLVPSVQVGETNGTVYVEGRIENRGNALAEKVVLVLETPFGAAVTNGLGHLDPGVTLPWKTSFRHPRGARPGRYAAVLRMRYADREGYGLDGLAALPYTVGKSPGRTAVVAALEGPTREIPDSADPSAPPRIVADPVEHAAALRLTVTPLGDSQPPARLRVALPDAFALASPLPEFDRLPASTTVSAFVITNVSAVAGSRLPIVALVETMIDGTHHTAVAELALDVAGERPRPSLPGPPVPAWWVGAGLLAWLVFEVAFRRRTTPREPRAWVDVAVLAAALLLVGVQLSPQHLVTDTLAIGGDTPAHHYLMRHLREQLLSRGRIVSWAPGWWCGFPMFQFYFPLPYLAMVLLDVFLPTGVAFKLGTVLGVFGLPLGAYAGGRLLRLPRPVPALLALATVPLLLDTTQTMWGVNLYSTLAGMIANSYGFALLPAALASAVRDAFDAQPRPRTVVLLVLVVLSHFFTALFAALLLAALFAGLVGRAIQTRKAADRDRALALVPIGVLTFLAMAWWLVPLVATRAWSVDFGDPWVIDPLKHVPLLVRWAALPAVAAALVLLVRRGVVLPEGWRMWAGLHVLMLAGAAILFRWGASLSAVFVNCRLWPFMVHALLVLAALAVGALVRRSRVPALATAVCVLGVLAFPWDEPNLAQHWSAFNYKGLEALPDGPVLEALAQRLRGTPGRLAYDLHPGNEQLGSSRCFEMLPALCGKPVLEGGIVNSALGSIVAYTVQGEMSDGTAGWPKVVKPRSFDPATGLRRLEFLGVRQFVARSRRTQAALRADPAWTLIEDYGKWQLFASADTNDTPVRVWHTKLPVVDSKAPQREIVEWLSEPSALPSPPILLRPDEPPPPPQGAEALPLTKGPPPVGYLGAISTPVPLLTREPHRLRFRTDAIGKPHLIAVSYFPNWRVRGARHVYLAAPGFMVVFPEEHDVELRFGRTVADRVGIGLTAAGLLVLLAWFADARRRRAA